MKVAIYSLGCKVNIYESEYVINLFKENNFEIVSFDDIADIYVINTCTVTNESDRKSRKVINQAKRKNKNAIIVVMGCYSQIKYGEIDADIVIGNKDKSKIIDIINEFLKNHKKIKKIYNLSNETFESMEISEFDSHTRAFVKIQDGCNAYCSYCIIPYSRGNIRSKKEEDVIREITNLVNNGYKEIVLTGIHTGKYGLDINSSLEKLLAKIINIKGLYRIRLSSIEINEVTDGILELMKNNKIIANHLHIPLQSGSDKILKIMNRKYNKEYFLNRISEIKKINDDISLTTDLIVGFPNEDEDSFKETLDTLNKIKFTHIHTFPYSKRDGTPAASMDNQVASSIKKERVKKIIELSNQTENNFYKSKIGKIYEGVTELRKDGKVIVHTSNFIPVILDELYPNNKIVKIKISEVNGLTVYGKILD